MKQKKKKKKLWTKQLILMLSFYSVVNYFLGYLLLLVYFVPLNCMWPLIHRQLHLSLFIFIIAFSFFSFQNNCLPNKYYVIAGKGVIELFAEIKQEAFQWHNGTSIDKLVFRSFSLSRLWHYRSFFRVPQSLSFSNITVQSGIHVSGYGTISRFISLNLICLAWYFIL